MNQFHMLALNHTDFLVNICVIKRVKMVRKCGGRNYHWLWLPLIFLVTTQSRSPCSDHGYMMIYYVILHLHLPRGTVGSGWFFRSPSPPRWPGSGARWWQLAGPLCRGRWAGCVGPPAWTVCSAPPGTEPGHPDPEHDRVRRKGHFSSHIFFLRYLFHSYMQWVGTGRICYLLDTLTVAGLYSTFI